MIKTVLLMEQAMVKPMKMFVDAAVYFQMTAMRHMMELAIASEFSNITITTYILPYLNR
jgi:hypothetical protein